MLQVIFKRLSAKNFLSIGDDPVEVDFKTGLNIITGKNFDKPDRTNGVGKSTVADALYFALFGTTIRELTKENILNNITDGKCVVTVEFDTVYGAQIDQYVVERTINPSKCTLTKNGEDITLSGIIQTTELIGNILHSTPELFQNGVIMTVNSTLPFMSQKKADKRKFIEGILNLGAFGQMLLQARADYNETKKNFDLESTKSTEIEKSCKLLKAQQEVFESEKTKKLAELEKTILDYQKQVETLAAKIIPVQTDGLDQINAKIKDLKTQIEAVDRESNDAGIGKSHYGMQIDGYKSRLVELDKKKGVCKFCNKNIDELLCETNEKEKQSLQNQIAHNEKLIKDCLATIQAAIPKKKKLNDELSTTQESITEYKLKVKENESLQARIDQLKKWIKANEDSRKQVQDSKSNFANDITQLEDRLKTSAEKLTGYKERLEIIDAAKFIVSEEGVKSVLIKKILNILNAKLAYYLKKMEANCVITFNEYFEETIKNEKGKECVYWNFSGAERKAIDLACLFTFMDIRRLQGDLSINVSMYDELLDSSLDEKGVDLVLDILKERVDKHKEAVYIISHRRESVKHVTGDVVYIEKRDGISRRVPYV